MHRKICSNLHLHAQINSPFPMTPSVYIPSKLKIAVIERAKNCCEYCKSPVAYSPEIFEVEHVLPRSRGGRTTAANLALSCPACNRFKGSGTSVVDPATSVEVTLFNPRVDSWNAHFSWQENFEKIEGKTMIGRAAVDALRMNRESVKIFRRALVALNLHPSQRS